jgi:hypothetical protein
METARWVSSTAALYGHCSTTHRGTHRGTRRGTHRGTQRGTLRGANTVLTGCSQYSGYSGYSGYTCISPSVERSAAHGPYGSGAYPTGLKVVREQHRGTHGVLSVVLRGVLTGAPRRAPCESAAAATDGECVSSDRSRRRCPDVRGGEPSRLPVQMCAGVSPVVANMQEQERRRGARGLGGGGGVPSRGDDVMVGMSLVGRGLSGNGPSGKGPKWEWPKWEGAQVGIDPAAVVEKVWPLP